jgi:hypothetical protein
MPLTRRSRTSRKVALDAVRRRSSWSTPPQPGHAGAVRAPRPRPASRSIAATALLVQQLLDPAQRSAQGLRIGAGPAHRQRGLKLGSDGIRDGLQRFRCISLRSAAVYCGPGTVD